MTTPFIRLIIHSLLVSLYLYSVGCSSNDETNVENRLNLGIPFSLDEFSNQLIDSNGQPVATNSIAGKTLGVYFSAHWCPPCRTFTPKLVEFRDQNSEDFEVVFVSSDGSQEEQFKYMKEAEMKWLTLPNGSKAGSLLSEKFDVQGIPTLVIISGDGKVLTTNGRGEITSNPDSAMSKWNNSSS